jgi:hypothetical protein
LASGSAKPYRLEHVDFKFLGVLGLTSSTREADL